MKKMCERGYRVLGPIREFSAHHEYDAKNRLAIGKE